MAVDNDDAMDLAQVSYWRTLAGRAGALCCLIALLAMVDGLSGQFRERSNLVKVLPGDTAEINGALIEEVHGVQDLAYVSDTDQLQVSFEAVHKGYFLGGDMWRGQLRVSPQIQPGEYHLTVIPKSGRTARAAPAFRIVVYPDLASRQASSKSMVRRYLGFSPFGVAALCVPGILLAFALVYLLSGKREALLAQLGKAEVYRVIKGEGVYEIRFALGTWHGLGPGARVNIANPDGVMVATARVEVSDQQDSVALATTDREIKVGYLVSR